MKGFLFIAVFLLAAVSLHAEEGRVAECLRQGAGYLDAGDYRRAVKEFEEAARLDPKSAEARRGAGTAYLKLGSGDVVTVPEMLAKAVAAFKEALRLDPASAQTRYRLGEAYLALDDRKGAIEQYESLKSLDGSTAAKLLSLINDYKPPASYRAVGASGESDGGFTRVTVVGNHVFVPVTLGHGDRTVQATLILDTGASITLINREVAERLNIDLARAQRSRVQVVGGGMVDVWVVRLDRLTAGPHTKSRIDVAVVDPSGGVPFDGLLGMNFLRSYNYRIDFANQMINWAP